MGKHVSLITFESTSVYAYPATIITVVIYACSNIDHECRYQNQPVCVNLNRRHGTLSSFMSSSNIQTL